MFDVYLFPTSAVQVFRHNHVGDWGTQFGMLINYMKEAYPNFLTNPPNITDLTTFYKAAKFRFDESEEFKEVKQMPAPVSRIHLCVFPVEARMRVGCASRYGHMYGSLILSR